MASKKIFVGIALMLLFAIAIAAPPVNSPSLGIPSAGTTPAQPSTPPVTPPAAPPVDSCTFSFIVSTINVPLSEAQNAISSSKFVLKKKGGAIVSGALFARKESSDPNSKIMIDAKFADAGDYYFEQSVKVDSSTPARYPSDSSRHLRVKKDSAGKCSFFTVVPQ